MEQQEDDLAPSVEVEPEDLGELAELVPGEPQKISVELHQPEIIEEPRLVDSEVCDPGRSSDVAQALRNSGYDGDDSDPCFLSDAPLNNSAFKDVIGIGGGSDAPGGAFGARFGGCRNLRGRNRAQQMALGEEYQSYPADAFRRVVDAPLSTFSIDVDRASYTNARRMINNGHMPPPAAIRVEEFINSFGYGYRKPAGDAPLAIGIDVASCPWRPNNRLVRVTLASRELDHVARPGCNLVFLVDVSGSMSSADKLPLFKRGLGLLVRSLDQRDTISIVSYAAGTRVVLEPTRGDRKQVILDALDSLRSGGSTNGAGGIQLAYEQALANYIEGGVNRVLLGTDGDFNVGVASRSDLEDLIKEKAKSRVFLTVLGFGEGNLRDATLEQIANKGNGHYLYVDSLREAQRVFVDELGANLVTVAKDVKLQVEFNPLQVSAYRLIGYVNRSLSARDFNDDSVDAGEVGAGHGVTAFFELELSSEPGGLEAVPLRYQEPVRNATDAARAGELLTVQLRFKRPNEEESQHLSLVGTDRAKTFAESSSDFRFATAVALFGEILLDSPFVADQDIDDVLALLDEDALHGRSEERTEFFDLVSRAREFRN